jgi:hypothetical protein
VLEIVKMIGTIVLRHNIYRNNKPGFAKAFAILLTVIEFVRIGNSK